MICSDVIFEFARTGIKELTLPALVQLVNVVFNIARIFRLKNVADQTTKHANFYFLDISFVWRIVMDSFVTRFRFLVFNLIEISSRWMLMADAMNSCAIRTTRVYT